MALSHLHRRRASNADARRRGQDVEIRDTGGSYAFGVFASSTPPRRSDHHAPHVEAIAPGV